MEGWHQLRKALGEKRFEELIQKDITLLDKAVFVIAAQKNDKAIEEGLTEVGFEQTDIDILKKCSFKKFLHLSFKAIYNLLPHLSSGLFYSDACEKCGYHEILKLVDKKSEKLPALPPESLPKNPVVCRTIAQFRKLYNAMVREYGVPDQINIEFARDLKRTYEERMEIKKKNDENAQKNEALEEELKAFNMELTGKNFLKLKLYKEQGGKCIYSGKPIDISRLDEMGYCEIDHAIPYSRSYDDSYNNKVLCLTKENREKTNQTPFEYLSSKGIWEEFKGRILASHSINRRKKEKILIEEFKDKEQGFKLRNANDNSYISKFMKKYLEDSLDFSKSEHTEIKNKIQVRSGSLTACLRHQWGLKKDRKAGDKHHAQDAIVIACATQGMVQYLSRMSSIIENKYALQKEKGRAWWEGLKHKIGEPWSGFRNEVEKTLEGIFVSQSPSKKATGPFHDETIRSLNENHKNYSAKDVKSGIKVRGGLANNGSILRTDVFVKKNKKGKNQFYLVPIYLSDMGKDLPNKAIVASKSEDEWVEMDETYTFMYSFYAHDLISVKKKEKKKKENNSEEEREGNKEELKEREKETEIIEILGYFKGTDRSTASITIENHDRTEEYRSIGVRNLEEIKKYQVDALGNYYPVRFEKRISLKQIKTQKQRKKDRYVSDFYHQHS